MQSLFFAKMLMNKSEELIFFNENKFTLISNVFPHVQTVDDFFQLRRDDILNSKVELNQTFDTNPKFLDIVESQILFGTGCTFTWSEEKLSKTSDEDVYKKIYFAERPSIFLKGTKFNMANSQKKYGLRQEVIHTIPEAELVAVFNSYGEIIGHTIGNDMTSIDLEKENPLYQMQGKCYPGSVGILPIIRIGNGIPLTTLHCEVIRNKNSIVKLEYSTETFFKNIDFSVSQTHKLGLTPLGGYLFVGCNASYPRDYCLKVNDEIIISSDLFPFPLVNSCVHI